MTDRMDNERPVTNSTGGSNLSRRDDTQRDLSAYNYASMSPFELMRRFTADVDRMFSQLGFGDFDPFFSSGARSVRNTGTSSRSGGTGWAPSVDVITRGDDLVIMADLPGINPQDVQVECDNDAITIRGETSSENKSSDQQNRNFWYTERRYGSFYRQIPLPPGVNGDNATARFNNGVLEITLPNAVKQLQPQRRRIEIQGAQNRKQNENQNQSQNQQAGSGASVGSGNAQSQQTGQQAQSNHQNTQA